MMKKITSIYKTFDVVVVPFPFVDTRETKNRPALIISTGKHFNVVSGHTILAMITSAQHTAWKLDSPIKELSNAGLLKPSCIRLKLFSLDNRLIKNKIGTLSAKDKKIFQENFFLAFAELIEFANN